jgi:hypothetical protein
MMSDAVKIAIVSGCVTALPIMLGQLLTYLGGRRQRREIAEQSQQTMSTIVKQGEEIHKVVNSQNTALITRNVELEGSKAQLERDKADIIRVATSPPVDMSGTKTHNGGV